MVTSIIVVIIPLQSRRLGIVLFPALNMTVPSYDGQIVQEDIMASDQMEEHRFLQVIGKRYFLTGSGEGRLGKLVFQDRFFGINFLVIRSNGQTNQSRNINRKTYVFIYFLI